MKLLIITACLTLFNMNMPMNRKDNVKQVITTFIEATDQQDADAMGATLHDKAMHYVLFGPNLLTFTKSEYESRLRDKKLGGLPRKIMFEEFLFSQSNVATVKLMATSEELVFHYQFTLLKSTDGWTITSINATVEKV